MKKLFSTVLAGVAMLCTMFVHAELYLSASSGSVIPGEWNSNFSAAKAYAEEYHMPMVVFWVSDGCSQCGKLERACNESDFTAWQAQRKIVMVFTTATGEAKNFARNSSGEFPYICVYWPKSDGNDILVRFTGRRSTMPGSGSTLQEIFINSIEHYISGWTADGASTDQSADSTPAADPTPAVDTEPAISDPFAGNQNYSFAYYPDGSLIPAGVAHVKAGKASKGKSRLTGKLYLMNGKTATLKSQYLTIGSGYVSADLAFGNAEVISVTFKAASVTGEKVQNLSIGGEYAPANPVMSLNVSGYPLPDAYEWIETSAIKLGFRASGKKWDFGKKSTVKYAKVDGEWVLQGLNNDAKPNVYQVSASYNPGTGFIKGSCKMYLTNACCTEGKPSLKKVNLKIYGFVINGMGVGCVYAGTQQVGEVSVVDGE